MPQPPDVPGAKTAEDFEAEARIRAHLRQQMKERVFSRADLARKIGTSDVNVGRILAGQRGIGLGLALRISRVLHVNPTHLLEDDPPEEFDDAHAPPPPRAGRKKKTPAIK